MCPPEYRTPTATPEPTVTQTPENPLAGDLDGNGCVDREDLQLFIANIRNPHTTFNLDIDGDGKVDFYDMFALMANTNHGCTGMENHPWWWIFFHPFGH
jgi:hypothetical protein